MERVGHRITAQATEARAGDAGRNAHNARDVPAGGIGVACVVRGGLFRLFCLSRVSALSFEATAEPRCADCRKL
ncbi:MAG TPA: hypothetical protein VFB31_01330 [Pseudolabrys sp.]|nr:hypothetical protein [Pseudolabrys sp.]